ncbi:MAG TPA: hypothetical protein VJR29_11635, partial [bacterium]|nr:hypothetical protein [bacterium]
MKASWARISNKPLNTSRSSLSARNRSVLAKEPQTFESDAGTLQLSENSQDQFLRHKIILLITYIYIVTK